MMEIHNYTDISNRIAIVMIVDGAQEQRTVVIPSIRSWFNNRHTIYFRLVFFNEIFFARKRSF